jgi:integrase
MAIRKREGKNGVSWQIDYLDPNGKRIRQSFKKKKDAEAELGKRVSLKAEGRYLDKKVEYTATLGEAIERYKEIYENDAGFQSAKRYFLKNFKDYFGEDRVLGSIKLVDIQIYQAKLKKKLTPRGTIRKESSINREMGCLHQLFDKTVEWEMIEKNPFDKGDPQEMWLKENNQRTRYLSEDEIDRLLDNCVKPWVKDIVMVVLHTGLRKKETLALRWDDVRDGIIYVSKTKTSRARKIDINEELEGILREIRRRNGLRSEYVFCNKKGRHINTNILDYAFENSLRRAGIRDFKFHDLRHTFASHFVMKGGSLKGLQELLGHIHLTMTLRYAHLSPEHKKREVNLLTGLTKNVNVTKVSHEPRRASQ